MNEIYMLVADDNPSIHLDFKKILCPEKAANQNLAEVQAALVGKSMPKAEFEFVIDSAYQGEEAVRLVRKSLETNRHYALAFIDVRMPPGIDGVETVKQIWELDPEVQVVICTAYSDYSWDDFTKLLGATDRLLILKKPFENIEVSQLANALAKKWQVSQQLKQHINHLQELVEDRTAELAKSLSLVKATLESTADAILVYDANRKIADYNQNFINMWEIPVAILQEKAAHLLVEFVSSKLVDPENFLAKTDAMLEHPEVTGMDTLFLKDGRIIERYYHAQYLGGKVVGRVVSFRDITQQKKLEEQLQHQATHDILTGLVNRLVLSDRIQQAITAAKRDQCMVAVLFIDLDHLKLINDTLGHDVGDEVLKLMATRLQECIRENDTLARIGGDEFVVVMPLVKKIDTIIPLCQKILKKTAEAFQINKRTVNLTASIGISFYPKDGMEASVLLKNADTANHAAKETGRNNFNFFTMELNINAMKRLTLENSLRQALEHNEFLLHYQPLVDPVTRKMLGVEALLRWQHPTLGLIPPQEFIPVAEETGLILPIGDWVLYAACQQNKIWQDQGLLPVNMAVNLTSKQLSQQNFVAKVVNVLQQTKLDPKYLELEMTESTIIEGSDRVIRVMQEFKNMDIKLVVDDFGTGYSSLNYINRLPIDKIKIDRSFVTEISSNSTGVAVILAILVMAKSLNIRSLAEGVETKEQLEFLRENHCDEIQGYYFSRPQSAENITKILCEQGGIL